MRKWRPRVGVLDVGLGLFLAVPIAPIRKSRGPCAGLDTPTSLNISPSSVCPHLGSGWAVSWQAAPLPGYQLSGRLLLCFCFLPVPGLFPPYKPAPDEDSWFILSARLSLPGGQASQSHFHMGGN